MREVSVAIGQVSEVAVHGYDPKIKKEFLGKAKGEGQIGEGAKKFGGSAPLAVALATLAALQSAVTIPSKPSSVWTKIGRGAPDAVVDLPTPSPP